MRVITKHFLTLFLPLAVLLGIVLLVFYRIASRAERKIMEANEARILDLQMEAITHDFGSVVSDLLFLADQTEVKNMLENSKTLGLVGEEWLSFSRRKGLYDQIRFLNETGMERVRVNYNDGNPAIVPNEQLQLKRDRYYFQDTFKLTREEIFVSPFDLNIEHREIEQPLKPMIRFGTPVFDIRGKKRGILLLNYLGAHILSIFDRMSSGSLGQSMLLNSKGFWLNGPDAEQEWGFMYEDGGNRTFGNSFPDVWKRISGEQSGVIYNADGFFAFGTVHPLFEGIRSSTVSGKPFEPSARRIKAGEYSWKIVSYVPREVLNAWQHKTLNGLILLYVTLIILLAGGTVVLARSHIEQKKAEKEKEKLQEQIIQSEKLASIGEIAAGIAHELNTPLNVILGYQELLQKEIEPGSPFEAYVKISIEEIEFCSYLIKEFLLYAQPTDPDKLKESISLPNLVRDVLRMLTLPKIKNINIKTDIDKGIPPIQGNHKQMMQVFINLINNAVQAMPGSGEITISTKLVKDDTIEFSVSDTGEGISEDNIKKVFDPFFTTKRPGKGTGLGLAVCVRIMENHKGTLRIESKPGKGTTIIGQLPVGHSG